MRVQGVRRDGRAPAIYLLCTYRCPGMKSGLGSWPQRVISALHLAGNREVSGVLYSVTQPGRNLVGHD